MLAFGWIGLVALAGLCVFVILLITLGNRNQQPVMVDQPTPTMAISQVTIAPQVSATQPPSDQPTVEATVTPPTTVGLPPDGVDLGGQVDGVLLHADVMREAGMTWVKYQLKWDPTSEPRIANELITAGHQQGFKVLLSISGQYAPSSIDFEGYTAYLSQVAAFQPDAIEVWNEMNLYSEWPRGTYSPTDYVNKMLAPAYRVIKAASPNTSVIIGALAPTGLDDMDTAMTDQRYVQGLTAAGAAQYADSSACTTTPVPQPRRCAQAVRKAITIAGTSCPLLRSTTTA